MFKGINQRILLLAIVIGLVTSAAVFSYLTRKEEAGGAKEVIQVVVATVEIEPRQVIGEEMLKVKKIPAQFVHSSAFKDPRQLLGKVVKERILAGEIILQERLLQGKKGEDSSRLSALIPEGKRAFTIAVDSESGVGGMLQPGDFVDILGTFDSNTAGEDITALFLQNIEILAIAEETAGEKKSRGKGKEETTVTLLLTSWEAEQLALAKEKGVVRLALRPFQPDADVFATNVVLSDLTRLPKKIDKTPPPPAAYLPPPEPAYKIQPIEEQGKKEQGKNQQLEGSQVEVIRGSTKELIQVQ